MSRAQNNAHVTGKIGMSILNNQLPQDLSKLVILKQLAYAAKSSNQKTEKSEHVCVSLLLFRKKKTRKREKNNGSLELVQFDCKSSCFNDLDRDLLLTLATKEKIGTN